MTTTGQGRVAVFGASGRIGGRLVRTLAAQGRPTLALGRREAALRALPGAHAVLDLAAPPAASPLRAGDVVINAAHARYTPAIAGLCPAGIARLVVLGSTRYRTRHPDLAADEVRAAAAVLADSSLPWVLLHPTMIYGPDGENNVQRMAALIRRTRLIPLPGGGRSLIQPVFADDVAACARAAIDADGVLGRAILVAGPEAVAYADFIRAIGDAIGVPVRVLGLPVAAVRALAALTAVLPGLPTVTQAEVSRLMEDKDADIADMRALLGVTPVPLDEGLRRAFAAGS